MALQIATHSTVSLAADSTNIGGVNVLNPHGKTRTYILSKSFMSLVVVLKSQAVRLQGKPTG